MLRALFPALIATLALVACNQSEAPKILAKKAEAKAPASQPAKKGKGESPADRDQVDADGVVRRGDAMSKDKPLLVSECIAQSEKLNGKRVKVEGTVTSVCAKKGCWFVVRDNESDQTIRITSKGYRFFVPKDARGKHAVIEGDLHVKTLSEADAKHLAEDSGGDPSKVTGSKKEVQLAAVGLEMTTPKK